MLVELQVKVAIAKDVEAKIRSVESDKDSKKQQALEERITQLLCKLDVIEMTADDLEARCVCCAFLLPALCPPSYCSISLRLCSLLAPLYSVRVAHFSLLTITVSLFIVLTLMVLRHIRKKLVHQLQAIGERLNVVAGREPGHDLLNSDAAAAAHAAAALEKEQAETKAREEQAQRDAQESDSEAAERKEALRQQLRAKSRAGGSTQQSAQQQKMQQLMQNPEQLQQMMKAMGMGDDPNMMEEMKGMMNDPDAMSEMMNQMGGM